MMQQYFPTPTRREYEIACPYCGRVHHFRANNFDGVKCTRCFTTLKMPPAPTERQETNTTTSIQQEEVPVNV